MADTIVVLETDASTQDVTVLGVASPRSIILATALIAAGGILQKSKVIEIQLEYESDGTQTLIFEYSIDRGISWRPYSEKIVTQTFGPTILACRRTIVNHNIQLRLRSTTLGKLRVISMVPRIVLEGKQRP